MEVPPDPSLLRFVRLHAAGAHRQATVPQCFAHQSRAASRQNLIYLITHMGGPGLLFSVARVFSRARMLQGDTYDAILVDAPCSADRHVLQQAATRRGVVSPTDWSVNGCTRLATAQLQVCGRAGGQSWQSLHT